MKEYKEITLTILIVIGMVVGVTYWITYIFRPCTEWKSGGYHATVPGAGKYYLSDDLGEARQMYDGLITQERVCIKRLTT